MSLTIERADVVAGVLIIAAVIAAIRDDKVANLIIGAAMVACHFAITHRYIFRSYLAGRSRDRAEVIDLAERRRLAAVPDRPRQDGRF